MNFNSIKEPYVLTIAHGRLGNILFQLSAGLKYAKDNDLNFYWAPLCTDERRDYKKYIEDSGFLDSIFRNISESYINCEFFVSRTNEEIEHPQEGFNNIYKYGFTGGHGDYRAIPESENIVLFGHFQNENYFDNDLCREIFDIPDTILNEIEHLYGDVSEYTSIHVRRGDFVSGGGLCLDKNYYLKCVSKFELNSNFLVISDDIEWCKQNIINEDYSFVFAEKKSNTPSALFDFYLMTKCANNICSKSTFSWWSAFLNKNLTKKVLYPTLTKDILNRRVPKAWIKIPIFMVRIRNIFRRLGDFFSKKKYL